MTYDGRDHGQQPEDPQQGYGQQYPQDPPWQPRQYDPAAHRRRIQSPPQDAPWQQAPYPPQDHPPRDQWGPQQPPQDYGQYQPPRLQRRRRSRWPLYAGIAALVAIAGGGAAYALTAAGSPAKPLTCKQQYDQWKNGPARTLAESFKGDDSAIQAASTSEDIPAMQSALKKLGNDAARLEQYPMPACADPAGDWTQFLAGIKAVGDNASSAPGFGGIIAAMAPMQHVKTLETKLNAELARTVGVKSAL